MELRKARFLPPTCCCHVTPAANSTFRVDPTFFIYHLRDYMTQSIYWRGSDVNSTKLKSFTPSHPPAWKHKSSFVSISTCLALHVPRCFVALCARLFKRLPFSLHLSLSLYPSLPHPSTFPLVIFFSFCGIWDPIHWRDIVRLLSLPVDGPRQAEWATLVSTAASHRPSPCFLPCDDVMAFICSRVTHWFSLLITHSLYLPLPPCYTPIPHLFLFFLSPQPVSSSDSFSSQKAPGGFGDVWMLFSRPTVHARHPERKAINATDSTVLI